MQKFRKSLAFIIVTAIMISALPIVSGALTSGDWEYSLNFDMSVTIDKYIGKGGAVTIPSKIDGKSVTVIGNEAFRYNETVTSVVIPNSVTEIKDGTGVHLLVPSGAFTGCINLSSVTLGNGITRIPNYAFNYCSSLMSIKIPNSVTEIGDSAFKATYLFDGIAIPNSVTKIGSGAFSESLLTEITIPNSVTEIGSYAFSDCVLLETVKIGNGIRSIPNAMFSNCSKLKSITIPNQIEVLGGDAFADCTSLTSVNLGRVEYIRWPAFECCTSLKSITIPSNAKSIMDDFGGNLDVLIVRGKDTSISFNYYYGIRSSNELFTIVGRAGSRVENDARRNNVPFTTIPAVPANFNISNSGTTATLSWNVVNGANGYEIFRRDGQQGNLRRIAMVTNGNTVSFKDEGLKAGETYTYGIRSFKTVNGIRVQSDASRTIVVKVPK